MRFMGLLPGSGVCSESNGRGQTARTEVGGAVSEVAPLPADTQVSHSFSGPPQRYSIILALTWKVFDQNKFYYSQVLFSTLDALSGLLIGC